VPNVTRRRRMLRLPRRYVVSWPDSWPDTPFVIWTGLPFVRWLTGHDCITIYDVVFAAPHTLRAETVAHEGCHVLQWRTFGFVGFLRRYLRQHRRKGYKGNGFEREADWFAARNGSRFSSVGA
jgi:hypothetical protein